MQNSKNYIPLFELGIVQNDKITPVLKIINKFDVNPLLLSLLVTTLCDFVINQTEESKQIQYEENLNNCLQTLMQNRFKLNVIKQHDI